MHPGALDSAATPATETPPLVSIVIAAYNAQSFIAETCQSGLRQTYAPLELIVVDDGSTDATSEIVRGLAAQDPRIRLIRQANQGVAAARNRGIEAAAGEFIAPLDADDLWDPTKIARQMEHMRAGGPDVGMVYCWWVWIDADGSVLDRSPRWRVEGRVLERLVEVNFTGSASVPLYRRSTVMAIGGYSTTLRDKGCQGCEDWDLAIRVAERQALRVVPSVLVAYRRRAFSMSSACETMWRSRMEMMGELNARQPRISARVLRRSQGQFALHLAGVEFWAGNYVQAFLWGLRARPLSLGFAVMPHAARLLLRRLLRLEGVRPKWSTPSGFNESALPEPLIPYDAIYIKHWDGDGRG